MNSLLLRQIRKHLPEDFEITPDIQNFLDAINDSYSTYNEQIQMIQRAVKISSDELYIANKNLREEAARLREIIANLSYVVEVLNIDDKEEEHPIEKASDLAKYIKKQSEEIIRVSTQREVLFKNLEIKNQQLNDYAHIVSHDLKSPLRSINTLVTWIEEDNKATISSESKEHLQLVQKNLEKMDSLINGILNYSAADKLEKESYIVDVKEIAQKIVETHLTPNHIEIEIALDMPCIKADPFKMEQLFQNLILNAVKSIDKEKGKIQVGAEMEEDFWKFYVTDNGKGIPQKYHEKIFKIF